MVRYALVLSVFCLCLVLTKPVFSEGLVEISIKSCPTDTVFPTLDDYLAQLINQRSVPGASIAVARDGDVVHWQGFGYADRDRRVPVESTTLFRIASVSKPITAVAVLRLVEAGRLSLEMTSAEVVPDLLRDISDANLPRVAVLRYPG